MPFLAVYCIANIRYTSGYRCGLRPEFRTKRYLRELFEIIKIFWNLQSKRRQVRKHQRRKIAVNMRTQLTAYFTYENVGRNYSGSLIMSLAYGLQALIKIQDDGTAAWAINLEKLLTSILL